MRFSVVLLAATAMLASGCAYRPGGLGDPLQRKFQYFSYLNGDDIRRECVAGAPARYRLVYNAIWDEQVRAYEVRRSATGEGAILFANVFTGGGGIPVSDIDLRDPLAGWRGQSAQARIDEASYLALIRAVEASGFGAPAPQGLTLPSFGFYWIAAACADGRFHFNAWLHPSERWEQIRFDEVLFRLDPIRTPVNPPRRVNFAEERARQSRPDPDPTTNFELRVGDNGLAAHGTVF